jgi:hypothetical protein
MDFAEATLLQIKCQLQNSCFTAIKLANFIPKLKIEGALWYIHNQFGKKTKELDESPYFKFILNQVFSSPYISLS